MAVHILFLIACFATGVLSNEVIGPCKLSDKECIDKAIREAIPNVLAGNPSLGVESSDPLFVDKIEGNLSIIRYVFYNSTILGYKNCQISDISVSTDLKTVHYVLNCNNVSLTGQYEISGRLVILPVEGKGDYNLVTGKYKITVDAELKTYVGSDGKNHLAIKNFKLDYQALSALKFDFKNLFNGQKDLSDAVHKFAHENWDEVAKLVQGPAWDAATKKVIGNVNKYLKSVVLEDMIIE